MMNSPQDLEARPQYVFTLYISGMNARSLQAIKNLKKICEECLPQQYTLLVIDLARELQRAEKDQIIATPTLIRKLPLPVKKIIGDLSDTKSVMVHLEIKQDKHE